METEQSNHLRKQKLLILLCCLVYSFAYAGRYSYNANIAPIMDFYGVTRAEAGTVSTFFFFAYGAGQLANAVLCKFYNKKYIITGALLCSAVINTVLFFSPPFAAIKYLWLLNGICQSILWPALFSVLGEKLDEAMMKRAVLAMSLSILIGTFLAYGGSALFNLGPGFRYSFLLGTVLTVVIGLTWFFFYRTLTSEKPVSFVGAAKPEHDSGTKRALTGALIGLLVCCSAFAVVDNFVKDGLNTWTPVILKEQFGFGDSVSMVMTLVLPLFGVFGSIVALQTHRFLKDFRSMEGFFYLLLSVCLLGLGFSLRKNVVVPFLLLLGIISCLAHGINAVLTGIMPLEMREKINSGSLAGLMNASCYIGSTVSAYGLGKIADGAGWNTVITVLLITSICATVLAGVVTTVGAVRKKVNASSGKGEIS